MKIKEKFDVISFCWPEMPYYSTIIEKISSLRENLSYTGKFLMILKSHRYDNDFHEQISYASRSRIENFKQKNILSENYYEELTRLGFKNIEIYELYNNDLDKWGSALVKIFTEERLSKIKSLSNYEKDRFIYLKNNIEYENKEVGWYNIILAE